MNGWGLLSAALDGQLAVIPHSFVSPLCSVVSPIPFQPLAAQILTRAALTRRWAPPAAPSRGSTWRRTAKRKRTERRLGWEFYCSVFIISSFTIIISELLILLTIQLLLVLVVNFHDAWRMWRARTQWPTWRPPLPESLARPTSSKTGKGSNSLNIQKDNSFIFFIHC